MGHMNPNWDTSKMKGLGKEKREPTEPMGDEMHTIEGEEGTEAPSLFMHSHAKGVTVHVMQKNGKHMKHEHAHGDMEGLKGHIDKHMHTVSGQDGSESPAFESGDE
jgi:hypothetical protein